MPLPVTFGTLPGGPGNPQSAALFDQQFAAVGALTVIPCTAVGQNAIVLTPAANTPAIAAYTNLAPVFTWVQPQTTTGTATIAISGFGVLNAYRNNGQTAIGSGDLVAGFAYQTFALSTLNSGAGGFVVDAFSTAASGGALLSVVAYTGPSPQTIVIPASATKAYVYMWGATGGSGGINVGGETTGGTGAAGYLEKLLTGLTPGNTLVFTFTGGGAGGANANGNGGNGGASTLTSGTQVIATLTANGSNGSLGGNGMPGTAGGTATGGDINVTGQTGVGNTDASGALTGGRNFYSVGADGALGSAAGNAGNPGGLKVQWLT
jgi:hypothetical protein